MSLGSSAFGIRFRNQSTPHEQSHHHGAYYGSRGGRRTRPHRTAGCSAESARDPDIAYPRGPRTDMQRPPCATRPTPPLSEPLFCGSYGLTRRKIARPRSITKYGFRLNER